MQRPIRALKDEGFTVVEILPGPDGRIDTQKFLQEIDKNTVLAACMAVNNETGAVQDIAALGKGIKARNSRTHFHVDAVQAWLRMPIDLQKWREVDSFPCRATRSTRQRVWARSLSGTASARPSSALHRRPSGARPAPRHREHAYIVGLGMAAALGQQKLRTRMTRIAELNAKLRAGLAALDGITLNSPADAVGRSSTSRPTASTARPLSII